MKNYKFALGWGLGLLLQLPVMLIFKVDMTWYLIQSLGLLVWFIFYFLSTFKMIRK